MGQALGTHLILGGGEGPDRQSLDPWDPWSRDSVLIPQKRVHALWGEGRIRALYSTESTYIY